MILEDKVLHHLRSTLKSKISYPLIPMREEEDKLGRRGPVGNISVTETRCCDDIGNWEEGHFNTFRAFHPVEG